MEHSIGVLINMMVKLALEGTGKRIHLVIGFDMELYATTS